MCCVLNPFKFKQIQPKFSKAIKLFNSLHFGQFISGGSQIPKAR